MVNLEHIRLLETRISRAVDYVKKVGDENNNLKERLGMYQTRIEELEVLVQQFKEEQSRIEDGILSALDRLNQFEDALESKLSEKTLPVQGETQSRGTSGTEGSSQKPAAAPVAKKEAPAKPAPKTVKPESKPAPAAEEAGQKNEPETDETPEGKKELDIF